MSARHKFLSALLVGACLLPVACASTAESDEPASDGALSASEAVVGQLLANPLPSRDSKATGVTSWNVVTVHNAKDNTDYAVAIGSLADASGRLLPVLEAASATNANGKQDFYLRSPDPQKGLAINASQAKALSLDIEDIAAEVKRVSNPQSKGACISQTVITGLLGLSGLIAGTATTFTCGPGILISFGSAAPACFGAAIGTDALWGAALVKGVKAAQCWDSRQNLK